MPNTSIRRINLAHIGQDTEGRTATPHLVPRGAHTPAALGTVREIFSGIRDSTGPTDTRGAILSFMKAATQANGFPPSHREIGEAAGYHLRVIEEKGYLRRVPGQYRNVAPVTQAPEPTEDVSASPRQLCSCPDIFVQRMPGGPLSHSQHE